MSKNSMCPQLIAWKNLIAAGEDPENVIPVEITCADPDDLIDIYFYCVQVLPDGIRREICRQKLIQLQKEVQNAGR